MASELQFIDPMIDEFVAAKLRDTLFHLKAELEAEHK